MEALAKFKKTLISFCDASIHDFLVELQMVWARLMGVVTVIRATRKTVEIDWFTDTKVSELRRRRSRLALRKENKDKVGMTGSPTEKGYASSVMTSHIGSFSIIFIDVLFR
jgi:hypothetical protein